jgi:hypothetical protein
VERSGAAEVAQQGLGHPHRPFELVAEIRGLEAHGFRVLTTLRRRMSFAALADAVYGDFMVTP